MWPSLASASARFTASVVFPTPPLPEPTAMIVSTARQRLRALRLTGTGRHGCAQEITFQYWWDEAYASIIQSAANARTFAVYRALIISLKTSGLDSSRTRCAYFSPP